MFIESTENEKVKYYKKLREMKYIKEYNEFIVEGEHLVEEAVKSGYASGLIILNGEDFNADLPKTFVSEKVLKHISTLNTPQYVMAVCKVKENKRELGNKIIILDGVQDPGNLGTIIRSSVAFGVDTIVLSKDAINIYNEKVVRASQGMIFKINIIERDLTPIIKEIKDLGITVYGTSLNTTDCFSDIETPTSYAVVLGNEGTGVKKEILDMCDTQMRLEINSECESLNVAVTASIIEYLWRG